MVHSKQQNSRTDKGQSMEGDLITKYTFMAYNNEIFTISNFAKTTIKMLIGFIFKTILTL